MKVFFCFLAICVVTAYCDVKQKSYDHDKAYGSEKEYGRQKKYRYESKDKSHGYDDDSYNKKDYGSEKEYGKEKKYGHESFDKSHAHSVYGHDDYSKDKSNNDEHGQTVAYKKQHIYHGKYQGHCGNDGFYYRDQRSFVICSNNNAYEQACAPGSRNSGFANYNYGDNYNYRDFCDVNLVDHDYGVKDTYGKDRHADDHFRGSYDVHDRKGHNHGDRYQDHGYHSLYHGKDRFY